MVKALYLIAPFFLFIAPAHSFIEVSLSGSYSESQIQEILFSKSESYTGSISYYFMERSALQLSMTQANRRDRIFSDGSTNSTLQIVSANVLGLDLIANFGDRSATIQPFLKGGVAQMQKTFTSQTTGLESDEPTVLSGLAPSAGLGVRLLLTKKLSVNFACDAWALPQGNGLQSFDVRVTGGISWFL